MGPTLRHAEGGSIVTVREEVPASVVGAAAATASDAIVSNAYTTHAVSSAEASPRPRTMQRWLRT